MKKILSVFLLIFLLFSFVSCTSAGDETDIWGSAIYTEDTVLGEGAVTIVLDVSAGDKTVSFTVNTDKDILGDALLEHELISGDKGPYGLYVKEVNGMLADYDINQSYWSLSKNGEYMQTGVDTTKISDGEKYELTYTK